VLYYGYRAAERDPKGNGEKKMKYLIADPINGILSQEELDDHMTTDDIVKNIDIYMDSLSTLTDSMAIEDTEENRKKIEQSGYSIKG
jgi:hypothetical protein